MKLDPDLRRAVMKLLDPGLRDPAQQPDSTSRAKSGWEPPFFEPVEKEAWDWALAGRNYTLLGEICGQARRAGYACTLFQDGLDVGGRMAVSAEIGLHPDPKFGLRPGTRLLMGTARRHAHAQQLREAFNARTGQRIEFCEADRPAYFGYATLLKFYLLSDGELIRPERHATPAGLAYHDVGVISFGPRLEFYPTEFVRYSKPRLLWIAAGQRLANYVGGRLVADLDFRGRMLGAAGEAFYADGTGMMVYRVTVINEGAGSVIRHFEYRLGPEFRPVVTV